MVRALVLLTIACALVVGFASPSTSESNPPVVRTSQLDQQWLDTVVSIERLLVAGKEVPIGTGFVVASTRNHLILVTAKHVVHDADGKLLGDLAYRLNRTGSSSQLLKDADLVQAGGGSWFASQQDDVAVRFLPIVQGASVKAIPLDRFIEERQVEAGTPLAALGFPMGLRSVDHAMPIARRGMVGRAASTVVLADLFIFPGNSGGPVLYVPAFKTGGISFGGAEVVRQEMLIGMVSSFIPYSEVAVSMQTKRPRVVFEENSGLANLVPAWVVRNFITTGEVKAMDDKLGATK
jgi:S1-C subfamily serine protease